MGAFSIWHWIILLAILGGIAVIVRKSRSARATDNTDPTKGNSELEGIGGWLVVLLVLQTLGILNIVLSAHLNFKGYDGLWDVPNISFVIFTDVAMNIVQLALGLTVLWAGLNKKRIFVDLFFYQWLLTPVLFILGLAIAGSLLGGGFSDLLTVGELRELFPQVFFGGLWVWYTRASVRVKNTMVN
jgi:hypothetical protein